MKTDYAAYIVGSSEKKASMYEYDLTLIRDDEGESSISSVSKELSWYDILMITDITHDTLCVSLDMIPEGPFKAAVEKCAARICEALDMAFEELELATK